MAEVVTTALLRLVFDKLSSKALKELGLLMGLDKELEKMETTLSTINDVLEDAEARQVKEKALRGWLKKLKDIAFEVDDVLDEVATKSMKRKVSNLFSVPKLLVFRRKIAHRLKEIGLKLDEIAGERSKFHLQEGAVSEVETETRVREQTSSYVEESEVYGRQEDKEKIVDFLVSMNCEDHRLGVIPVVGMGGLGKTTLAKLVYNDERVRDHFGRMIWVCVSEEFEVRRIGRSILESVTGNECSLKEMDSIQRSLREELRGQRFLLVLDDVWNENHGKWDRLRMLLSNGVKGCRVIVTTRSDRVASIMGSVEPHLLTGLSEEDCCCIFEKRAFGLGGRERTPDSVAIGREIARKCGGVPLAAEALGSLVRFRRRKSEWLAVRDSEIWELSGCENEILPALKLSYNYLPSHLKQCFAYCSIFPKDYEVRTETLAQLWIAEGFIESSEGRDVGLQYVDELLSRSLFQNGESDTDGISRQVKMHDLVHDLARHVAGEECSIIDAGKGRFLQPKTRYSSLYLHGSISEIIKSTHEAERLRTLYVVESTNMTVEQDEVQEFLQAILSNLKLLRALYLVGYPVKDLPDSARKLKHLRYLNLSNTDIVTLPPSIGTLQNLQNLDLSRCTGLRALPDSIGELSNLLTLDLHDCLSLACIPSSIGQLKKLKKLDLSFLLIETLPESLSCLSNLQILKLRYCYNLRELPENTKNMRSLTHLDIYHCHSLRCMPAGIGQLSHLRILPMFVIDGKNRCSIVEISGLDLENNLSISNLENVRNVAEAWQIKLKEKRGIQSLKLSWDYEDSHNLYESMMDVIDALVVQERAADSEFDETVLEALQPQTQLKVLEIEGFIGRTFPCWMMELSLPNLVELSLTSCFRCEDLPALGQLPFLKVLKLSSLPSIKCLGSGFYGDNGVFPSLEELHLTFMPQLVEWSGGNGGEIFPCLTKLCMAECSGLTELPSTFPSVTHLAMFADDRMLLKSLENGGFPKLEHLDIGNLGYDDEEEDDGGEYPRAMPEVLARRMSSIGSWTVQRKLACQDPDSSTIYIQEGCAKITF